MSTIIMWPLELNDMVNGLCLHVFNYTIIGYDCSDWQKIKLSYKQATDAFLKKVSNAIMLLQTSVIIILWYDVSYK